MSFNTRRFFNIFRKAWSRSKNVHQSVGLIPEKAVKRCSISSNYPFQVEVPSVVLWNRVRDELKGFISLSLSLSSLPLSRFLLSLVLCSWNSKFQRRVTTRARVPRDIHATERKRKNAERALIVQYCFRTCIYIKGKEKCGWSCEENRFFVNKFLHNNLTTILIGQNITWPFPYQTLIHY